MDKNGEQDREDKRKIEEYKKNPMSNVADSMNRKMVGDLSQLTKGGCLTRIITSVIIIIIVYFLAHYINHN
ncbi:DUF6366 family protein [Clostridium estertheticum]|uniref:DUF6366 family protein n=1 Tax=Clostridium frigoriphilum TaxID=443253 RepID=A0ABU7UW68_9CLOT|nr:MULTISPECIES: DUF6366 family protein [Clostridium]MBU3102033.1 hypothetical protein [Clostridium sp. DSM 17811]MBU3201955.1 hypothetical protein [Clostridium estertheticum]MCB2305690.1 DUF6366 family protein [Clostridium estertheticum]MCB2344495.1 DUF6366 family protein [Clostridium estertheticum]MCB2348045.1 DUF6366 family protein [Clostridium estertheticum]